MTPLVQTKDRPRVLIVDMNNFATFPTLAIGILVASLRNAGLDVRVLCPLAYNVPAAERERRENFVDQVKRRVHQSTWRPFQVGRNTARRARQWWVNRPHRRVIAETARAMDAKPDIVLLSAYLQHYHSVCAIGRLAKDRGIPLVVGGPVFNMDDVAEAWRSVPGLTAIVGAEVDASLPALVQEVLDGGDLLKFEGVVLPDGRKSVPSRPMRPLSQIPLPDFTDFPWDRYRMRVVPVMAGRGCQWAKCTFCSDVVSASGRTFRSRTLESVLYELREQSLRHQSTNFLFLDLKLNSNPAIFRGISENIQRLVPGAQWIGTVHVDERDDNGLTRRDLRAAAVSGMRRISFGLESGSQRMLDLMQKGSNVERNAAFIRDAHEAGLSVRCTMFKGYPGETAQDLEKTASFLEEHQAYIDRVRFNDLSVIEDTPLYEQLRYRPETLTGLRLTRLDQRHAKALFVNADTEGRAYRRAKARLSAAVYAINRRKVRVAATAFDGMM